jgi:hypothetical protein
MRFIRSLRDDSFSPVRLHRTLMLTRMRGRGTENGLSAGNWAIADFTFRNPQLTISCPHQPASAICFAD